MRRIRWLTVLATLALLATASGLAAAQGLGPRADGQGPADASLTYPEWLRPGGGSEEGSHGAQPSRWDDAGPSVGAALERPDGGLLPHEDGSPRRVSTRYPAAVCPIDTDFNGAAGNWVSHSGTWYIGSEYLYTSGVDNAWASASYVADFDNFDYEARLWRSGCESCANFIVFRGTPDPLTANGNWYHEYKLQYTREGQYSVWVRVGGGSATPIVGWTYSSAINPGDAWNTLRVVADGTSLTFYINGTLLWSGTDAALSSGRAGVGMYDGGDTDELRVDWARLCTLAHMHYLPVVSRQFNNTQVVDGDSLPDDNANQDVYRFSGTPGQRLDIRVDTVSLETAFDIEACLSTEDGSGSCFAFGDDDMACTYPPPSFGCPRLQTTLPADADGMYYLLIESGSGANGYAGPVGLYRAYVRASGAISPLQLIHDNQPGSFRGR